MNKGLAVALISGGLLLTASPDAAAHKVVHGQPQYQGGYYVDVRPRHYYRRDYHYRDPFRHRAKGRYYRTSKYKRTHHIPRWLQYERGFAIWYHHSPLRRNKYITWQVLYDIYRAETRYRHHY